MSNFIQSRLYETSLGDAVLNLQLDDEVGTVVLLDLMNTFLIQKS